MTTADSTQAPASREIVSTRLFDYPRERVFQAFRDPGQLTCWWGPRSFTNTFYEFDLRPGGQWRFMMHGPDGTDYPNESRFIEVVPGERVILDHLDSPKFRMTLTFADEGGKTRLVWRMLFESDAEYDRVKGFVPECNEQNFDRLEAQLAKAGNRAPAPRPFVIERVVDAPRELVWKAYTERDRLVRWFGPKGFSIPTATLDLRPGGFFHYCMRAADGFEMWGKWIFHEIAEPERLVHTVSFSDAGRGVTRHPMSATWPLESLSTTTFTERDGRTTVHVEWTPLNATEEEQKTFEEGHESMQIGFSGTFDKLEEYLAHAGTKP